MKQRIELFVQWFDLADPSIQLEFTYRNYLNNAAAFIKFLLLRCGVYWRAAFIRELRYVGMPATQNFNNVPGFLIICASSRLIYCLFLNKHDTQITFIPGLLSNECVVCFKSTPNHLNQLELKCVNSFQYTYI